MNAPFVPDTIAVRAADLAQPDEAARIDAFVREHDDGTPFHLTRWSRAVAASCGHTAHCLIAETATGAIAAVLPLTELRSRLFGKALISNGFAVHGGPLAQGDRAARAVMDAAWAMAQAKGIASVELRGPAPDHAGWIEKSGSYVNFARALKADDDAELLGIPRKQRAEVRRSLGFDLAVEIGRGERDRAAHYAVYAESVRNLGTPVFPRALFDAVLDAFGDAADILTIRHEGRAIASVLTLYHQGRAMPYWGGGTADARTWRANDRMYFELMNHARRRGCTVFDFGRSKPGTGAYAFKKNWGFEPEAMRHMIRTADGEAPREINPLNPKYRLKIAAWQKLPLWMANRLGPLIARDLA